MLGKISKVLMVGVLALPAIAIAPSSAQAAVPKYNSCTDMYKKYGYGIKLSGAKDKVNTATRLPNTYALTVSKAIYNANIRLDTDRDKIACERTKYKNCKAANLVYKHGAGIKGAKDSAVKPVTNFNVVAWQIYTSNKHLDRDGDKVFCEKL